VLARAAKCPSAWVVAGPLVFGEDTTGRRMPQDETAFAIQRGLPREGVAMLVLPVCLSRAASSAAGFGDAMSGSSARPA